MPKKLILVLTITLLIFPFSKVTAADQKYWNPGHYITLVDNSTKSQIISEIEQLNTNDYRNIKGVKIKMWWEDFEPTKDNYNFDDLDSYIGALPEDTQIFVLLLERDFQNKCNSNPRIPGYIVNYSGYPAENLGPTRAGCIAHIWDEPVMGRYIKLLQNIGERYKDEPKFGGVMMPETAINIDYTKYASTQTQFRFLLMDQLVRAHNEISPSFNRSFLIQKINYLGGDHPDYAGERGACGMLVPLTNEVVKVGGALSNPDTVPLKAASAEQEDPCRPLPPYEIYRTYKGQVPIMVGNDTSQLGDPLNLRGNQETFNGKVMNFPNLIESLYKTMVPGFTYQNKQVEGFGANYIFWNGNFYSRDGGSQPGYLEEVLKYINANSLNVVTSCPGNIECVSLSGANPTPTPSGNIPTPTPPTPSPTIKYDPKFDHNDDNKVNLQDVIEVIKFIFG